MVFRVMREAWEILLYDCGLAEVYERPLILFFHLVACLVLSLLFTELLENFIADPLIDLILHMKSVGETKGSKQGPSIMEPKTPDTPGDSPRNPFFPSNYKIVPVKPTEKSARPVLTILNPYTQSPEPDLSRSWNRNGPSPAGGTPKSPWSVPPILSKLLNGILSPGYFPRHATTPFPATETSTKDKDAPFEVTPPTPLYFKDGPEDDELNTTESVTSDPPLLNEDLSPELMGNPAAQQIEELDIMLQAYKMQAKALQRYNHSDPEKRIAECKGLSDTIEKQIVFQLDGVKADDIIRLRSWKKSISEQALTLLKDLEDGMQFPARRNPVYGEVANLFPAASKISSVVGKVHWYSLRWDKIPPAEGHFYQLGNV